MGDRIAILKQGGVLAQYATPAELLMAPADDFVEDFVGADRALKRLALTRVRDVDLRAVDNGLPFALIRDEAGRPVAWERARRALIRSRTVGSDESLRDVLSELLLTPLALGRGGRRRGSRAGACSTSSSSTSCWSARARSGRGMSAPTLLAQAGNDFFRDRSDEGDSCVANNGFCPDWIAHNLDRYVSPFWQHMFLVVVSVGIGFAIAFALALLAHRRRWLVGPITQVTGILYTIPSLAFFFLLLPITGRGNTTALIALAAYTLLIIFRNIIDGLDGVPEEARDAGRGMGLTDRQLLWRVELPLALPEIMAGLRIAATTTVGLAALAFFAGAGGLGDQMASQKEFNSNVAVGGGAVRAAGGRPRRSCCCAQRLLTPWTRVRTA